MPTSDEAQVNYSLVVCPRDKCPQANLQVALRCAIALEIGDVAQDLPVRTSLPRQGARRSATIARMTLRVALTVCKSARKRSRRPRSTAQITPSKSSFARQFPELRAGASSPASAAEVRRGSSFRGAHAQPTIRNLVVQILYCMDPSDSMALP
eukprot:6182979-Pleurochrysis_carterae.AAC.6